MLCYFSIISDSFQVQVKPKHACLFWSLSVCVLGMVGGLVDTDSRRESVNPFFSLPPHVYYPMHSSGTFPHYSERSEVLIVFNWTFWWIIVVVMVDHLELPARSWICLKIDLAMKLCRLAYHYGVSTRATLWGLSRQTTGDWAACFCYLLVSVATIA